MENIDYGTTRNFATETGDLALLNGTARNSSPDIAFSHSNGYTIIQILTTGFYELSYSVTYRVDANPDIEALDTFIVWSDSCSSSWLQGLLTGFAGQNVSMILDSQIYYPVSGNDASSFTAGTCFALKARESLRPASGNRAEMVRAVVVVKRLR